MGDDKKEVKENLDELLKEAPPSPLVKQIVGGLKRDIDSPGIKVIDGIAYEFVFGGEPAELGKVDMHGNIHYPRYGPIKKY